MLKHTVLLYFFLIGVQKVYGQNKNDRADLFHFENDLIYAELIHRDDTLLFYTDTGGKNFLYRSGLRKLGLSKKKGNLWCSQIEEAFNFAQLPLPLTKEIYFIRDKSSSEDGMLGREWFAKKRWHFDYKERIMFEVDTTILEGEKVPIFFRKDTLGYQMNFLPRLEVAIEGKTLSLLFDTGAQAFLSKEAQNKLQCPEKTAISFIDASTFDAWTTAHPDWVVIKDADRSFGKKADIIMVPSVQVGQQTLYGVAFAKRDDHNFRNMSEHFMDRPICGALGGNALNQLSPFTLDYVDEALIIKAR
jgi:hypothetical protein